MIRIAAAVILAAATAGGCASSPGGAPAPTTDLCEVDVQPEPTGILTGPSIKGTVWTRCKVPPRSHTLEMHLQRWVNGEWVDQATRTITRIPPTIQLFNLVTAPCIPGAWHLSFTVDGIGPDGAPYHADGQGDEVEVKPNDCG
jgi:hypothetical protein